MKRLRSLFAALLLVVLFVPATVAQTSTPTGACGLAAPAFCDTFDAPVGGAERSGDLDGAVWGVSRTTSNDNLGQGIRDNWADAALDLCGTNVTAQAGTGQDVRICNGQLQEAVNDNHQSAVLAMYPRQPFDIAGRTGTVAFDVSALSQGPHAEWPAFLYTDQPVPAPDAEPNFQPGVQDAARNSFGFALSALCGAGSPCNGEQPSGDGSNCVTVGEMWKTANYAASDLPSTLKGCVMEAVPGGPLNHFEVRMSQSQVQVWGTDPGGTALREIVEADNANLPLTRGLVWMEDVHYNADKFNTQGDVTIAWDNFGFDGPVLPRDLGVELPDNTQRVGGNTTNLGWQIPLTGGLTQTFSGTSNVAGASAALLEFTCFPQLSGDAFTYSFNGHAAQTATPTMGDWSQQTVALPVSTADLVDGANTLTISDGQESVDAANFDLILVGAGGIPATATPTATATPVATTTSSTATAAATGSATTVTVTATRTVTQTITVSASFSLSCSDRAGVIACTGQ